MRTAWSPPVPAMQRCSREVEMNRVEWMVDEKYWIALEIVNRRRAGLQSRRRSGFPVFPIFVNRIVPELERNQKRVFADKRG